MYSQRIINANLDQFAAENGWAPVYHSFDQIQEFKAYIDSLTKMESNSRSSYISLVRPITDKRRAEIKRWIENEQALCGLDSGYFESRYAYVCDEKGQIYKFRNRKSQEIFDSIIADFDDKQVSIELLILKARQVGMCLSPETRVLTADLKWISLDEVKIGEKLVAIDEGQTMEERRDYFATIAREKKRGIYRGKKTKNNRAERRMRTTTVEAKWDVFDHAIKMVMDDGRVLIATPSHKFLSKQRGGTDPVWRHAKEFCVGDSIRYITSPWENPTYEDGWFGGFADGEGSMPQRTEAGVELSVSQRFNCAYERARKYLEDHGYSVRFENDDRKAGDDSKLGNDPVGKLVVSRGDELFRLIGQSRPARFITRRWWEGKSLPGKKTGIGWRSVISIELLPKQRMIDIQTSTKTFIAEGFVSHNSTKTALKFIHRLMFIPHTQAVMASVQTDKSELIGRILDTAYNRCPWWLVPRKLPKKAFDNGSILSIQSGMQATGIAQGWTPQLIHISEISDIPNPEKTIEEGLLRATHSSRNLFMVFEGTGGGNTGWVADTWRTSKEDWPKGKSRLCPTFIPWPMATDLYPEADWIRKFPVDGSFDPHDEATRKHVARCESYIRNTPYLSKIAGKDWRMPIEQQWFWQFNYKQACKNHTQKIWLAQMAADDFEALTGVHDSVFEPEVMQQVEDRVYEVRGQSTKRRVPVEAYAIQGDSIDDDFMLGNDDPSIDWNKQVIEITWKSHRGKKYTWQMIPLLPVNEDKESDTFDKLLVYEEPQQGEDYSCGIDTAYGLGKEDEDRTCVSMEKNKFGADADKQVCEFTSLRMNSAQIVGPAACIAAWYSAKCRDWRGVKFAIEQITGPGDTCQNQLKLMGFNYHHSPRRYDSKKVKDDSSKKQGWYSSGWSVPILMTRFIEAVNGGWYEPQSKWLIEEMKTLERHVMAGGKTKMEHRAGQHDDRVRAAAQAFFTVHDLDDLAERAQKRYALPQKKRSDPDEGVCKANLVSVGDWE